MAAENAVEHFSLCQTRKSKYNCHISDSDDNHTQPCSIMPPCSCCAMWPIDAIMSAMNSAAATSIRDSAEADILTRGLEDLRALLPATWKVEPAMEPPRDDADLGADALINLQDSQGMHCSLVLEVKRAIAPRDVETLGGQLRLMRRLDPNASVMVFAPWLSSRTRVLLEELKVGYLDLTGNVRLELERPALVIRTDGAALDPNPPRRQGVSVRGTVAGRVVRLLADIRPPYTASAIATVAGVSLPYVSRLLTQLDREALVRRGRRGLVVDVDVPNLLRRRAETYTLFGTNKSQGYLSGTGARDAVRRMRDSAPFPYRAVTGSFAAVQRAPIAAPSQLTVYVDDFDTAAEAMNLMPTDQGADVVLLRPYDFVVVDRFELIDGLQVVAPSQLVLDCLSGNGRMPAEGQALLTWMTDHEAEWRRSTIEGLEPRAAVLP